MVAYIFLNFKLISCSYLWQPFIEEFSYPIQEDCAGGNTGVYVNGRELHQKDLILLGNRGLPTERDRSYVIEMSGRVLDEDSGEELDSLGKLAPTLVPNLLLKTIILLVY